ncbi:metallophosphoesterase [Paenibacillus lupini]
MIYITGDIHGTISVAKRLNIKNFPKQRMLTKQDYVIITGDFGLVWKLDAEDKFWLKWLNKQKTFTTLFIDGNHENFDLLESAYPIEEWNGGKVHKINDSVFHLMRGQVFHIDGLKFFTFGGAASHDKEYRTEGKSWWSREMPSEAEYEEGIQNLDRHNWAVDYVLTHTCSVDALEWLTHRFGLKYEVDHMHSYFQVIQKRLKYRKWYFGHFHQDTELTHNQRLVHNDIIEVNGN